MVFIHPTATELRPLHGLSPAVVDFPFDTTRTAVDLVVSGVMHRHRHVKVILSHAGGFLPYAAQRFAGIIPILSSPKSTPSTPDAILAGLKRFYFDTALSTGHDALKLLAAFAEPGHVLYGSDWPYAGDGRNRILQSSPGHRRTHPTRPRGDRTPQRRTPLPSIRHLTAAAQPAGLFR